MPEPSTKNGRHFFQRPDLTSTHLDVARTSLSGYAGALAFNKIGGEYVHSNSYVYLRSPGFDTNDLGFLRRADQIREGHWLQVRSNKVTRCLSSSVMPSASNAKLCMLMKLPSLIPALSRA